MRNLKKNITQTNLEEYEVCIMCGAITDIPTSMPLKMRTGYLSGAGQLTVIEYAGKRAGMHRWKCVCDCGNETIVGQTLLQTGKTKSYGCIQKDIYG